MKLVAKALLAASFFLQLVSCSNSTRWIPNCNDIPSLSEFERLKKPAKPTVAQVKTSLQLRADEFAKDPESFKVRRIKVGPFFYCINKSEDRRKDVTGYLVSAETDSKNSYGGYVGYRKGLFIFVGTNILAFNPNNYIRIPREGSKRWDQIKKIRNETSDKEWDKWVKEGNWVKLGREDAYKIPINQIKVDGSEAFNGWNSIIVPKGP